MIDRLCGNCYKHLRATGDWLCQDCRQEVNEAVKRAAVNTGDPWLLLAWTDCELMQSATRVHGGEPPS